MILPLNPALVDYRHTKGYSWKANQFGLTIDTVQAFNLVLPNGTSQTVTSANEDLWFGLRVCDILSPYFPCYVTC